MALKKMLLKAILPSCLKTNNDPFSDQSSQVSKRTYQQRLSISDISYPSDLSSSAFLGSRLHIFTLKELQLITQNFSRYNFLDKGGFGEVYKGFIDDKIVSGLKPQAVAVKSLNLDGAQGHREWLAEVIFLGQLKHPHLVNLIGYCCEDEDRLLVYEYMERGSLEDHLFKRYSGTLPWLTRIKIALGAAKGLGFLHEEIKPVIYRDFKTSNVLLDVAYTAKLSDFGFATDGPEGEETFITTSVMGTEGYAAPEYMNHGCLTTMSDVYSFGVVLLELLTGRRSIDKRRACKERDLVEWGRPQLKDPHKLERIMDPRLDGQYSSKGAKKAASLAYNCMSHNYKSRPTMSIVVKTLESLLDLTDIPIGPFVYVVPTQTIPVNADVIKVENSGGEIIEEKTLKQQKSRKLKQRWNKSSRSHVYSDTVLYNQIGTTL